jgi:ubiquinone/menaquinone biosynthesis C-methylase UbiE
MADNINEVGASGDMSIAKDEMDWDAYARHYDLMCELNPAYRENINLLSSRLEEWPLPPSPRICDIGAGTGNYIAALSSRLPDAEFWHLDMDERMNQIAREKYRSRGVRNVNFCTSDVFSTDLPPGSFDLILCINSLYAISPHQAVLERVHDWLAPNGRFFTIDFGRKQRTLDWAIYMLRESLKSGNTVRYARGLFEAREVVKQNRRTRRGQSSGRYWLHTTEQFGHELVAAGFEVDELFPCYRGYADLAVCRLSENYSD